MQGIFVNGRRPKSKKEIKDTINTNPNGVRLETTSAFGNEPNGIITEIPDGTYYFVGPCPYTKRNFYGSITKKGNKITIK